MELIGILLFLLAPILVIGWCEYMANGVTPPKKEHKKAIDRIIENHAERKKSMGGKKNGEPNNPDQTPGTTTTGLQTKGSADGPAGGPDSAWDGVRL